MPERHPDLLLADICEAIERIARYTNSLDFGAFLADDKTIDAVVRNLEIIGEAAKRLPKRYTEAAPEVPWHQISGLRNRIVHDYFGLDLHIIWQIIQVDVPKLKIKLCTSNGLRPNPPGRAD